MHILFSVSEQRAIHTKNVPTGVCILLSIMADLHCRQPGGRGKASEFD